MTNESEKGTSPPKLNNSDIEKFKKKYGFTEEQIQQFKEAFSVFDRDADGVITTEELGAVMVGLGHRPSRQELEALIKGVDTTNSGTVDLNEFLLMMSKKINVDPQAELEEVFAVFDMNSDGVITSDELYDVLNRLGETISKEEVDEMIKEADTNCDGVVDISEFKGILTAK